MIFEGEKERRLRVSFTFFMYFCIPEFPVSCLPVCQQNQEWLLSYFKKVCFDALSLSVVRNVNMWVSVSEDGMDFVCLLMVTQVVWRENACQV